MSTHEVVSEIAGTVWQLNKKIGDTVEAGEEIMIIESMKMEIPVLAEHSGVLKELRVDTDSVVSEGEVLAVLDDKE